MPTYVLELLTLVRRIVENDMPTEPHRNGAREGHGPRGPERGRESRPDGEGRKLVMLVDDDASLRTLVRVTLPPDAFDVIEAADGLEALELLEEYVPDVVVLDWNMPGRSGGEVLAELDRRHANLAVIVLTAERQPQYRAFARSLGADEFLTKPFSPLQLLSTIERLVAHRLANQPA